MNEFSKHSKGQMMVLFAGVIAALLGATALCSDVALMYVNSIAVQKAGRGGSRGFELSQCSRL